MSLYIIVGLNVSANVRPNRVCDMLSTNQKTTWIVLHQELNLRSSGSVVMLCELSYRVVAGRSVLYRN